MNTRFIHSALLIFFIGVLMIVSCKKDMKNEPVIPAPGNPFAAPAATPVSGSVSGIVVDENNTPVNSAQVKLGNLTTTTNSRGIFSFNNAILDKYITTVTVIRAGYFKAYRSFSANATRNYLDIKLIPRIISGTLNTASGGVITLNNGTEITFKPNSMVLKSDGSLYNGSANVYATYIDPTAPDISALVPGSFMATDGISLYNLQSTGMIAVDIDGDAGQPLQLATGLPATI